MSSWDGQAGAPSSAFHGHSRKPWGEAFASIRTFSVILRKKSVGCTEAFCGPSWTMLVMHEDAFALLDFPSALCPASLYYPFCIYPYKQFNVCMCPNHSRPFLSLNSLSRVTKALPSILHLLPLSWLDDCRKGLTCNWSCGWSSCKSVCEWSQAQATAWTGKTKPSVPRMPSWIKTSVVKHLKPCESSNIY